MELFGTTIKETINAFREPQTIDGQNNPTFFSKKSGSKGNAPDDKIKAIGRIIVSVLLIVIAIYLLDKNDKSQVGASIITGIIGYWIK